MDERDWLIFHVLYEKRNITKTGQALFISQPALTTRLRQIEEELGSKLVFRSGKGIHFTPQGEYLAKRSKAVLAQIQEIKDQITNMHEDVRGTLRIAASHYVTKYKLPQLLKLFKREYPDIEFKVTTSWSKEVMNLVNHQEAHVGFVRGEYPWPDKQRILFEECMCIASTEPVNFEELPSLPKINYRTDDSIQILLDNWWRENFSVPPFVSMEVDRLDTCKEMVLNGLGYAIMSHMILDGYENVHKIIIKNKNQEPIIRKTSLIYQEEILDINAVNAFIRFCETIDFRTL